MKHGKISYSSTGQLQITCI